MVYIYHSFLIHSSADGHLGCFHVLAMINSAAMNIGVYVSLSDLETSDSYPGLPAPRNCMQSARCAWEEWLTGFWGEGLARFSLFQSGFYSHLQKWMLTRIGPWWWRVKGHPSLCCIRTPSMVPHRFLGPRCPVSLLIPCLPRCGLTPLPGYMHHAAATRASRPVGSHGQIFSDYTEARTQALTMNSQGAPSESQLLLRLYKPGLLL